MTPQEVLARGRSVVGRPCSYKLGSGRGQGSAPWDREGHCDCSGLVCWLLGIGRETALPTYVLFNGGWVNTDGIVHDATNVFAAMTALFTRILSPSVGGFIVYPGGGGHAHGHIGLISEVKAGAVSKVIHCSASNPSGHAIAETEPHVFTSNPRTIYVWKNDLPHVPSHLSMA